MYEVGALATAIEGAAGMPVNVYPAPPSQVVPPAVVIRPDEPWMEPGEGFVFDIERYVAICAVTASDPDGGLEKLYGLIRSITGMLADGWSWTEVTGPQVDESTGTPFLVVSIRLAYRNCEDED